MCVQIACIHVYYNNTLMYNNNIYSFCIYADIYSVHIHYLVLHTSEAERV